MWTPLDNETVLAGEKGRSHRDSRTGSRLL